MRALGGGGGLSVSADEHGEIVNAIASRDPQRAGTALRRHVADSRARMHKALGREPAAPSSSSALSSTKEA
jgi:DNA-binding GntR family transcriptional regulator